jgi:uncharacterized membrane protein YqhA
MIGVVGSLIASLLLFTFGFAGVLYEIINAVTADSPLDYEHIKSFSISLVHAIDAFLLATVLYIVALGLYELFIDDRLKLPPWLMIHTLEDLKEKLLSVVLVILPVLFLGRVAEWERGDDILWLGLAITAVVVAIGYTLNAGLLKKSKKR